MRSPMLVLNPLKAPLHVEQNAQQAFGLWQYTGSKILSTEFKEYRPITIVFSQLFQAQNVLFCGVLSASIAKQISIQNQTKTKTLKTGLINFVHFFTETAKGKCLSDPETGSRSAHTWDKALRAERPHHHAEVPQ